MITLHESTEMSFTTNGLGALSDAITCEVTEERNGEFELEMEYPVTGIRYKELQLRRIIMAKPNPYSDPQPFRIYAITKPINGIVTINAEHISYDMSGYPVSAFAADTVQNAFINMKSASAVDCPFSFSTDKITTANMTVLKPSSMRSLLGGVDGSILDVYGGEYEFDKFNVKLWNKRGADRGVSIRYGKNLTDLKQEENCSSVYTGVYPFWYSEQEGLVQLNEKIVKASGTYNFTRIYPLDLSQEWQEKPSQEQLRTRANSYMKANNIGVPAVSLTVSFAQLSQSSEYAKYALLEDVHLCDTVGVEFPKLNVSATAKCIKTIYDAISNKYASIELGESRTNLASTISDQKQAISDTITKTFMQQAIENATQLISGGLGGFVIMHSSTGGKYPDEILIMDTDDIATAKKVWRWNKGGLGYSSTGYNGPFALAMTQDGQIVADFVKTGTMSANRINGGTLILGGKNNSNGTALIKDADGNVLIRLDRDGITLSEDVQISYENISDAPSIPTKVSELTNDSKYTTMPDVEKKGYQTKANVTKITKDTVTTTYVNALDITAKQVNCKSGSKEANINAGASHYKYSNEYIGEIGTNSWTGNDNRRGLVFDLDENGDYMTWAAQPKSGQNYLVKLLYERNGYTSNTVTYNADTINLGCDVDMHYYKLKKLEYRHIPSEKLTGEKWMAKSVNIGDQLSQVIGIYYPHRIDTYVKYVRQQKFYGRYMDDWYIMNPSKEELEDLLSCIIEIAKEYGIHINRKKTHIVKISSTYKFLQIKYTLTKDGKVIKRINPKRVTTMRRKLKELSLKVINGEIEYESIENMFRGWMGAHYKLLSKQQRKNLIQLYEELFNKKISVISRKLIVSDASSLAA